MSIADNLAIMLKASQTADKDWSEFCDNLYRLGNTVREMEEEGQAVSMIVESLSMGGVPSDLISQMTNEKLATLLFRSSTLMREHGPRKNYLSGMLNERGTLDLYLFRSADGHTESVTAPIPDFGNELASQMMLTIWIQENMKRYADSRNAIILDDITNFMCGID